MIQSRVLNNAKWIIVCKAAQSLIQMIIGMISARYLGPANYGLIGYASSVVAFVLPLMQLGLQSTLVQELIETPEKEGQIMGTALAMDIFSGVVCMALVAGFVAVVNRGERVTIIVCVLYSTVLLFRALELMQYWFQYKLASKYSSMVALCSYVVVSAYKVYVLAAAKDIYWFAVVNSIDYAIIGVALIAIFRKLSTQDLSVSPEMAKRLFSRSKYYILASMMATVYQNTDHIMLKMMVGDIENGYYTAAITCTWTCAFIYAAVIDSFRPMILNSRKTSLPDYENQLTRLYGIIIYMSILQGVGFTAFARLIVRFLYGSEYLLAIPVLQISIWQVLFCYIGTVRNIWILAEGKQYIVWKINLAGALCNVLLNAAVIPRWGACGAAFSSLVTPLFMNCILGFVLYELRESNRLMLKGMNILSVIRGYKEFRR